jgi:NAD+ diphosphatase
MNFVSGTHPSQLFSYCPQCGHKDFRFDSFKSFTCAKCSFNYYINAAAAVAVILKATDGSIVLTRRKFEPRAGFFDLPGGFVDPHETAEAAVKREIQEELGISVGPVHFITSFPNEYVYKGLSYFTCDLAFVCPVPDLSLLKPADDVAEALVVRPHDIDFDTISFPSIVNILKTYIDVNK